MVANITTAESGIADAEKILHPPVEDLSQKPKTKGEWFYDILQFMVGKVAIMAATGVLAYVAKYGKDHYGPVPNYLKRFQSWFHGKLLNNGLYTITDKSPTAQRLAGAAANTMVTFHGGNLFAPIMKWMENNEEHIANWYNRPPLNLQFHYNS